MKHFTELIHIDDEALSFSFIEIFTTAGPEYFVGVLKDREYLSFLMGRDVSGKWIPLDSAPQWVRKIENQLSEAIKRNS